MKVLENIASDLEQRITDASIGNSSRPTILFCGCDPRLKKDLYKRAKRIGLRGHIAGIDSRSMASSMGHSIEAHHRAYPYSSKASTTNAFKQARARTFA